MAVPRVVVVGAGFGGLWCARGLADRPVHVVLVDRNNYHTFFPLLYQVAAAELVPTDIAYPVRAIFRHAANVEVHMAEVTQLDVARRCVGTSIGDLPYDALVLAMGSVPHFFGVEGAAEHAFPLRWMEDAIPLRHHILTRFEAAAATEDPLARRRLLTFAVVGGGPTGVEFSGALAELIYGPLLHDYPGIDPDEVAVVLLEAADRILTGMPERLGTYAAERLRRRRVKVRLGVRVDSVGPGSVLLNGRERVSTETVVWTAGVQGDPAVRRWGLPVGRGGRIPVDGHLHVVGHDDIYAVGDLAYLEGKDGAPLPQVAQVAIQQGRCVARNILATHSGQSLERFRYKDLGMLAVIGRNAAVAHVFGRVFRGLLAWILWLAIHIAWLIGFRNRALVLVNWAWNYVFFRRAVRLILPVGLAPEGVREASPMEPD
ncbi:MAG: NAD(P)/FAD-dependent oxidoreductase [Gemmatimonadota bacterium]|jgi:NADH dehydrogenase